MTLLLVLLPIKLARELGDHAVKLREPFFVLVRLTFQPLFTLLDQPKPFQLVVKVKRKHTKKWKKKSLSIDTKI